MRATAFSNRAMFWRIVRRLLTDNPGRLAVMLLALGAGAAITAALLNLQVDARRRLTTEFRAFGANVIISPPASQNPQTTNRTMPEAVADRTSKISERASGAALLYAIVTVSKSAAGKAEAPHSVVVAGFRWWGEALEHVIPWTTVAGKDTVILDAETCQIGYKVASEFGLAIGDELELTTPLHNALCLVSEIRSFGGPEDSQIFLPVKVVQQLAQLPGRISLIQVSAPGTPQEISNYISALQRTLPDADVRPIRQFTEGEARIYNRISGVLSATIAIVLVLTTLCVMAAMTNVAMERKNDVGLMKAIGGAARRVLRLFLMEAALLGLTSGLLGAALGIALSIWLGKAVFGLAARPRLIVYPVAVALTIIVAIAGAFPLRRLANIRPASVFRGET